MRVLDTEPWFHMVIVAAGRHSRALLTVIAIVAVLLALGVIVPSPAKAQPPNFVSGNACAGGPNPRWQSGDTWIMYGNVTVPFGCTLTIEPGAFVKADQAVHLYIHGQLLANGTSTSRISFDVNATSEVWAGIQFNRTSTGSYIEYATIHMAVTGVKAIRSSPFLQFDIIDHAVTGVEYWDSSGWVGWTTVNYTLNPIRANGSLGSPVIVANTITTVLGDPRVAIYVTNVNTVTIQSNTIRGMFGANRSAPFLPGARGADGGFVIGIAVNGSGSANLAGNTVDRLVGGRGADGAVGLGNGGAGGTGGSVTALVIANTPSARMQNNGVTNLYGGHGGDGGGAGSVLAVGGTGGNGGDALAMEILNASLSGWWFYNSANGLSGGSAGNGGAGVGFIGNGGGGGNAYGLFALTARNANASNLGLQNIRGGYGGNSSNGPQGTTGGAGGQAGGLWIFNIDGTAIVGNNTVQTMTGGQGGSGFSTAGMGGAATAILLAGDRSPSSGNIPYNLTTVANNQVTGLTGGVGGLGSVAGPNGGTVAGLATTNLTVVSLKNAVKTLAGGLGGSAATGQPAGSGGDAFAFILGLVPRGTSSRDSILSISGGSRGTAGTAPPPSRGVGVYVVGNRTLTSRLAFTNGSVASVSDFDLYLDNYTATTALNSTFSSSKLTIERAANLTVQNFLSVKVLWPNNVTTVSGARVAVKDNGAEVYNQTSPIGNPKWIVLTNRVYINRIIPQWNTTRVTVSYLSETFGNNPRTVNMTLSQTQYFTMVDRTPPTTGMTALPTFTTTRTFTLHYSYSDGFGSGVSSVTLWDRVNGSSWSSFAIVFVTGSGSGQISFTAASDGTFEFAATAVDAAANQQLPVPPAANQTWTLVDTSKPSSRVTALPIWETSLSFLVSWGPNPGTTDIASYTVQYNNTGTWATWLSSTTLTSSTFTATSQGVYQFRTLARDFAGNVEPKTGNDTWTTVDSVGPTSAASPLPAYETAATFGIVWGPTAGTVDIADYIVQISTDGGPWVTWLSGVTNTSATFTGANGHRYAFRSLATDWAGNSEAKAGNDTWTNIDTTPPNSLVSALPTYEPSLSFVVSWGPNLGVTDIASYRIEYNHGSGWVTWLGDTTSASATFNLVTLGLTNPQGSYAFRSTATDRAGNVETKSGNDTWTIVDTIIPTSSAVGLPGYETTASFAVSWGPAGTTADVRTYAVQYSIDGAAWTTWFSGATNRTATFSGVDGHRYAFRSLATDYAGNAEAKSGNDTWTIVDTSPPASLVSTLSRYETTLAFPVNWGPAAGTTDVSGYTIQVSLDGGTWTTWLSGVSNRSAVFSAADGHTYGFRSLAMDYAGNAETKTGNDTFTSVDVSLPSVVLNAPEGAGVDTGTTVTVTFSEPMNEASVEQAFSLSPSFNGALSWNAAGTVLTFTPARPLSPGTAYTVVITTGAKDPAGNSLGAVKTFTFTTSGSATPAGFSFADWWPLLIAVAVGAIAAVILLMRRRGAVADSAAPKPAPPVARATEAEIDDVFLLYNDGILIKHETLRLRPDIDTDILSGMLTAVQQFVKDSFQSDDEGELNEITVGQMHLHIGRGKWLILAARVGGGDVAMMNEQIRKCIQDMEDHHRDQLEDWDGDMGLAKVLGPFLKRLIRGEYA